MNVRTSPAGVSCLLEALEFRRLLSTTTLVDFGSTAGGNVYGTSWTTPIYGNYTSYNAAGPAGVSGGSTGVYHTAGVSGGTARNFAIGDQIRVTWYNYGGTAVSGFTPRVSFDDSDYTSGGDAGTWLNMNTINVPAGQSVTSTYTVDATWAGNWTFVNANRNLNGANLLIDKIEHYVDDQYTLSVANGTGDGSYSTSAVVNVAADAPPSGYAFYSWTGDTAGLADIHDPTTTYTIGSANASITANFSPVLETIDKLRESSSIAYVNTTVDDAQLTGGSDTPDGAAGNLFLRNGSGSNNKMALIGMDDLFSKIPATSGGNAIQILDAKLHLFRYNAGAVTDTVYVNRVTSDWMTGAAGTNEADVTFAHRDKSASLTWAGGNFGTGDYDTAVTASGAFSGTYNGEVILDITSLLSGIYGSGQNNGLVLRTNSTGTTLSLRSSEAAESYRPYLEINYTYGLPTPMHHLAVENGTGDGYYWEGQAININADSAASGNAFNMWVGDVGTHNGHTALDWADQLNASEVYTMPAYDAAITATYRDADRPLDWTQRWDYITSRDFGAEKEALTYEAFGSTAAFETDGTYSYVSQNSAYLTAETTLPTKGYIEYGTTTSYGNRIEWDDRFTYLHGFHLNGLANNTTYHYRFVMVDERDNALTSGDATFTTAAPSGVNYISGGHYTTPYVINASGHYLLTGDVTADYSAFVITANNVTLDFGGHTVVYNNVDYQVSGDNFPDFIANASYGVKAEYKTGINLHNGIIQQGDGANAGCTASIGYSAIFLRSSNGNVTGIRAEVNGSQVQSIHMYYSSNLARFNIIEDHSGELNNRMASVSGIATSGNTNHNLILRSRHAGITVSADNTTHYDNEIYIDSIATNSFGIGLYDRSGNTVYENRIFGGGYLMIAIGVVSHSDNIDVLDNFIHMQANEPDERWPEYGTQSGVNGFRQTWGGVNLNFEGNYVIAYGQDGGYARNVWAYQDEYTTNITYTNNVFKTHMNNSASATDDGSIIVTASGDSSATNYVTFTGNRIISNFANINHGTSLYGVGSNARYIDNTFVKTGNRPDYRLIHLPSGTATGHEFIDSTFEGGASYNDYVFSGTGTRDFTVIWTLTVETEPGASVVITDVGSNVVFSGVADGAGIVSVPLKQFKRTASGQTLYTDHTVTISKLGFVTRVEEVTMDQKKTLEAPLSSAFMRSVSGKTTRSPFSTFRVAEAAGVQDRLWEETDLVLI